MTRFRKGPAKNWEGREWVLAPSLVVLAAQIETVWPEPEPGDGTVASKAHDQTSPNSDHRPAPHDDWTMAIVRAIDSGETSEQVTQEIVDALVRSRDPRIMYLIYEGRSCWSVARNGFLAWVWQPYGGVNPHEGHFHLSTKRTATADNDIRPWDIGVTTGGADLLPINPTSTSEDISWLQDLLNYQKGPADAPYPAVKVDGTYGPLTIEGVRLRVGYLGRTAAEKAGEAVGYRQWNSLQTYFIKAVDDDGGGGVTPEQVDQKISIHADDPDAHHE